MNKSSDTDTQYYIRKDFAEGLLHLAPGEQESVPFCGFLYLDFYIAGNLAYEVLYLIFKLQFFYEAASENGYNQTQYDIGKSCFEAEDAGEEDEASEIHHGRGYQKAEGDSHREACRSKAYEERNRGTGAEGGDGSEQCCYRIGSRSVKTPQYLLAFFGREIALDIGYDENKGAEQYADFDNVVNKEVESGSELRFEVEAKEF